MNGRSSISRGLMAWVICLLLTGALSPFGGRTASASDRPLTRPARLLEGDSAANMGAIAPAPPPKSKLDSEPIRHRDTHGGTSSGAPPHSEGMDLGQMSLALAAVLGLIGLLWWGRKILPQVGAGKSSSAIQVLGRSALSPRQQIVLIRVGRRVIVVGDSGGQMNSLSQITDPDEVAALIGQLRDEKTDSASHVFGSLFNRAQREMSAEENEPSSEASSDQESSDATPEASLDPAIEGTRDEISGLMEKIRGISSRMKQ